MKKLLKTTIIALIGAVVLLFVGTSCIQDVVTPTYVDKDAAEWAGVPVKLLNPFYTTLADAKRVGYAIDYKLTIEKIKSGYYKSITNLGILGGEDFKGVVFNPNGLLSLLMVGGPMCALGAYGISKPADRKKIKDLEVNNVKNHS